MLDIKVFAATVALFNTLVELSIPISKSSSQKNKIQNLKHYSISRTHGLIDCQARNGEKKDYTSWTIKNIY